MIRLASYGIGGKGLLIFKHLEQQILKDLISAGYMNDIRKYYYVGLYFGGYTSCDVDPVYLDVIIARKGVISNEEVLDASKIIRFSGSTFIPSEITSYRKPIESRTIDVIGVFNRSKHKRPEDFVLMAKALHKIDASIKIKLITYGGKSNNIAFLDEIYEHPNFVFEDHLLQGGRWPLSKHELYMELSNSKNFVLTSRLEGSSRTVFECALLETRVFVRPDLKGGTVCKDLMASGLLGFIDDLSRPVEVLSNRGDIQTKVLEEKFLETNARRNFKDTLTNRLKEVNEIVLPNSTSFSKILPSHAQTLPSKYTNEYDDQLSSMIGVLNFLRNEEQVEIRGNYFILYVLSGVRFFMNQLRVIKRVVWRG